MLRWFLFLTLIFNLQFSAQAEREDAFPETRLETQPETQPEPETLPPGYVFGVTVRSVQELDIILDRADSLRELFDPDQHGRIAIVLHGDELQLFQKDNYAANQSIVERARLLDQEKVIDIKACQTRMRILEIEASELPGFIEQVPFAPAEIERLEKEHGFTRL